MDNNIFFKEEIPNEEMPQSKFYFYNLILENKEGKSFDWEKELNNIHQETIKKTTHYEKYNGYTFSINIAKKEETDKEKFHFGFFVVTEDKETYKKEKRGDFLDLEFDEDEHLCNISKGKLYFLIWMDDEGNLILMLERQYFSKGVSALLSYFKQRYSPVIESIESKNIIGNDLKSVIRSIKDNKIKLAEIYFKKKITKEEIKGFGYVDDAISRLLDKGIYADVILRWKKSPKISEFFMNLFKKTTFENTLDVDFGEFLRIFNFETDNDAIPSLNLLDKIISFILPLDKTTYSDDDIFSSIKEGFNNKKSKLL